MNWRNILSCSNLSNEAYINYGLYDASAEMALRGLLFTNIVRGYDVAFYLGDFLSSHEMESDTCYDLADTLLIIAAFCKYISYDSIYEIMYCVKDKKVLFNIVKRVLSSDYFIKIPFRDEGETVRSVFALSDKGLKRVATLIPNALHPDDLQSRKLRKIKNSGSYIAHDYYCGMNFLRLLFSGYLLQYKREIVFKGVNAQDSSRFSERKAWAFRTAGTIRTDAFAYFLNFSDKDPRSIFYIEQDTGTEDAETVLLKLGEYYVASFIGYSSSHNVVYSYRERMKDFIDTFFPYLFNKELVAYVSELMSYYNCDLYSLICRFCFSEDVYREHNLSFERENRNCFLDNMGVVGYDKNTNKVGSILVSDFVAVCNYTGKIPYDTLYMTAICAQSIFRLFSLPGIEQVFGLISSDDMTATMYNALLDIVHDKLSRCEIDIGLVQDYGKCCQELLCMNPFYVFLKESFCYSRCMVRKNKLLTHLMKPFVGLSKSPAISSYHYAMISGADAFLIPTTHIGTYAYSLFPRYTFLASDVLNILKRYYGGVKFIAEYGEGFTTSPAYPDLYMRNFYRYSFVDKAGVYGIVGKEYSGEVYVEHTCVSLSALFRTRFFLEKYCGLNTDGRHVTIVCLVDSFNDAVNTALFLDYWKYINVDGTVSRKGAGGKIDICTHDVEVCFCLYSDLIKSGLDLEYLFHVVKDEDNSEAIKGQGMKGNMMYKADMRDGMYMPDFLLDNKSDVNKNKGNGYGSKQGIVHSCPDGQCKGFKKVLVYAPFTVKRKIEINPK